ncbi:uncharacterized protein LOC129805045 [Phlebotomus papatasi]|uniref:uncharacterized protein LOC129805045 n=1 Tax=Phlebotomus papatasi TaxID=29031 RepID=UPI00248411B9|nr:uncharacterized protein LOC129805045 [Phlebotomus papatasi]
MSWFEVVQNQVQNTSNWIKFTNDTLNSESVRNFQKTLFKTSNASTFSTSQIGILIGIFIAILVNLKTNKQFQKCFSNNDGVNLAKICAVYLFILPIFSIILGICLIYRNIVNIVLKVRHGERFKGILDANDAVWTVESETWTSIINILVLMEDKTPANANSSEDKSGIIVDMIRNKFQNVASCKNESYQKIFYHLNRELGYSYWTKGNTRIEDYVRCTDIPTASEFLTSEDLRRWFGMISNTEISHGDHSCLWEILVCRKPFRENGLIRYPIICRVHHSLGDGVALLRFFLEGIADQLTTTPLNGSSETLPEHYPSKEARIKVKENLLYLRNTAQNTFKWTKMIISILFYLVEHISTPADLNSLHGPSLSGRKTSFWIHETEESYLLPCLRKLKRKIPDARFSDLILTSLSSSLYKYFAKSENIPKNIKIIVPARVEALQKEMRLENKFSVALQRLPIVPPLGKASNVKDITSKVSKIKEETDKVRSKSDYAINFAIMTIFGYILPYPVLSGILDSKLATMVFSNLPGPTEEAHLGNFKITNLSFSVPHRDTTGIGITLLTYAGKMHFAISADTAVVPTVEQGQEILQEMENEIRHYVEISEDEYRKT